MKFSHCGRLLATGGQDNLLRVWVLKDAFTYFSDMRQKYNEGEILKYSQNYNSTFHSNCMYTLVCCVGLYVVFDCMLCSIVCCVRLYIVLDCMLCSIVCCVGLYVVFDCMLCWIVYCVGSYLVLDRILCWIVCCSCRSCVSSLPDSVSRQLNFAS